MRSPHHLKKPLLFLKKISLNFWQIFKKNNFNFSVNNSKDSYWPWLFSPFIFALGCIFYLKFPDVFHNNIKIFVIYFVSCFVLFFYNFFRSKYLIYLFIGSFLSGIFYNFIYDKIFLNYQVINFKSYLKTSGVIKEIKPFYNPINKLWGVSLLIKDPVLEKINFNGYRKHFKQKKSRKYNNKKKSKIKKNSLHKNNKKLSKKIANNSHQALKNKDKLPKNFKNLINLKDFQDLDRKIIDYRQNSNQGNFITIANKTFLAQPPPYVKISVLKNFENLKINQNFNAITLFQPLKPKEFSDDFDFELYSRQQKIAGYGFAIAIIDNQLSSANNLELVHNWQFYLNKFIDFQDNFFADLRKKITQQIFQNINYEQGSIALALLIGDQSKISDKNLENIRQSGLSHLLSISGFHLSLASLFFLVSIRKILSYYSPLTLRFDLKKISAFFALFASYFYLMLSNAPIPAQRAFIMVLFLILSYFFNEQYNGKRTLVICFFIITLFNPYQLFNLSFQLSFIAILVMLCFYQDYHQRIFNPDRDLRLMREKKFWANRLFHNLKKIYHYFYEIFLISTIIQIATLPFLIYSFSNFSLIAPLSNIIAIPLTSLLIMPSGFIALILMPLNLEKIPLVFMEFSIKILQKIIDVFGQSFLTNFHYHNPSQLFLVLSASAIVLFCLWQNKIMRILAIIIFLSSFFIDNFSKKPSLIISGNQNSYAIFNPRTGLEFSELRLVTKNHKNWLKRYNQKKILYINSCDKNLNNNNFCQTCTKTNKNNYCVVYYQHQSLIVIKKRSQISQLCRKNYDVVVNLTKSYQTPFCYQQFKNKPLIIDNIDFVNNQTLKLFYDKQQNKFLKYNKD